VETPPLGTKTTHALYFVRVKSSILGGFFPISTPVVLNPSKQTALPRSTAFQRKARASNEQKPDHLSCPLEEYYLRIINKIPQLNPNSATGMGYSLSE
jgi:hypothetical protein